MRHVKRAVRADLARFKAFIEMQELETGAWRGVIEDGELVEPHDDELRRGARLLRGRGPLRRGADGRRRGRRRGRGRGRRATSSRRATLPRDRPAASEGAGAKPQQAAASSSSSSRQRSSRLGTVERIEVRLVAAATASDREVERLEVVVGSARSPSGPAVEARARAPRALEQVEHVELGAGRRAQKRLVVAAPQAAASSRS